MRQADSVSLRDIAPDQRQLAVELVIEVDCVLHVHQRRSNLLLRRAQHRTGSHCVMIEVVLASQNVETRHCLSTNSQ